ncbi:MAG TPA: polyribonucleotide nucleotidyltransferase [Clostridiales bacterium]|nr:polyribonucleotide nucleotidyltransferase [Clostridiales bacterium]
MKDFKEFKTEIGGKEVTVEIGKYAMQTNGHCIVKCGDTMVMVNTCMNKEPRPGQDFFPLSVDYEEKLYAVGKIPGGFKKREGRPTDQAILTSRLIDRPLRPLFPKGFFNDVTVVATPLSVDYDVAPEPLAMFASSIALSISDIPFAGPTGSCQVAYVDGKYIVNPNKEEQEKSLMDLKVAGTKDAILMVEAGANEVSEEEMLQGILFAHKEIKKQVEFQEKIVSELGVKKAENLPYYVIDETLEKDVREFGYPLMEKVMEHFDRHERDSAEEEANAQILEHFAETYPDSQRQILDVLYKVKKEIMRAKIIEHGVRPDGRKLDEIRPIWCEAGILPRVHGSAVFTRGETQVMTTCTLGSLRDTQILDGLDDEEEKRYMHHYNFPAYSTGEAKPLKSAGRREIGHGALAERSLVPVLPSEEEFPYAIRTVSEVLSSNGSTSQASVCGSTLALMDAGVPIKAPVAGCAMGLIKDEKSGKVAILTDIQGLEDFLGDMDFKVAGTTKGITAIQMDIKIKGIDEKILREALSRAREGRLFILNKMNAVLSEPRKELSPFAPKIISFSINPDKIKDVIGSGGKMINKIIDETGVKIDIEDDGLVMILGVDQEKSNRAKEIILSIAEDVEVGKIYTGKVVRILQFGAFVEIGFNKEGMIHISKLSNKRVEKVEDVVNIGDMVEVECIKVNDGKIDLKLIGKYSDK